MINESLRKSRKINQCAFVCVENVKSEACR